MSKVVDSALFGVTAQIQSGWISSLWSGTFWLWDLSKNSFVPIFQALPADKREQGGAHLHPVFHKIQWYHSPVSHSKLELFGHSSDLLPVNTPEHSIPESNSSKEMLSNVKLFTPWCWLPQGNTHLSSKSVLSQEMPQKASFEPKNKEGFIQSPRPRRRATRSTRRAARRATRSTCVLVVYHY